MGNVNVGGGGKTYLCRLGTYAPTVFSEKFPIAARATEASLGFYLIY